MKKKAKKVVKKKVAKRLSPKAKTLLVKTANKERKEKKSSRILKHKFNKTYNEGRILVELPPSRRMIFVLNHRLIPFGKERSIPYFVSMPKIRLNIEYRFIPNRDKFCVSNVLICFFDKLQVYHPIFSNLASNFHLCCNRSSSTNLENMVDQQIKLIFQSEFTTDLMDSLQKYGIRTFGQYHNYLRKWEKKTKLDPNWTPGEKELKKFTGEIGVFL